MRNNTPLISVIIPIANQAEPQHLKKTLDSIFTQSYQNFEVIVVIGNQANPALSKTLKQYPKIKIFKNDLGKAEARNYGAQRARGKHLLLHDADAVLVPSALKQALKLSLVNNNSPVSLQKRFEAKGNYGLLCRNFDLTLHRKSGTFTGSIFLEKTLFLKIGGYDPQFDPLDDWELQNKLGKINISIYPAKNPLMVTFETTNLLKIACQKYIRGRTFGLIKKFYPKDSKANFLAISKVYLKNIPLLLSSLHLLPGLFVIKLFNTIPFYFGMLFPKKPETNYYENSMVARIFEEKGRRTNYGEYKHFCETTALETLLPRRKGKVIEVGAGTGRITKFLVGKGFKVTATEPSEAMLKFYRKKRLLPKPVKASGENLPFENKSFSLGVAIRVLWHIRDKTKREQFLEEICRVCRETIILDITNKNRYANLFFRIPGYFVAFLFRINFPFEHIYLFNLAEFERMAEKQGFKITKKTPLEVTTPFWLNLLPKGVATSLFPLLYRLDLRSSALVPPGRFILKLERKPF